MTPLTAQQRDLVEKNRGLAYSFVWRRFRGMAVSLEDLSQVALLGLCRAAKSWEPSRSSFGNYSHGWMLSYVRRHLRRNSTIVRPSTHWNVPMIPASRFVDLNAPRSRELSVPAQQFAARLDVERALVHCTPLERRVLRLRYGLGCEPCSLRETAPLLGVSPERVRQIENEGLGRIRYALGLTTERPAGERMQVRTRRRRRLTRAAAAH